MSESSSILLHLRPNGVISIKLERFFPSGDINFKPVHRVFLNQRFGEPVLCTSDCAGFRHLRGFVISAYPALNPLVCGCLSCLRRFCRFRDSVRCMKATQLQTIGLANHRRRNARISLYCQGSVNGGFETVVQVWSGEQILAPHCNLNLTSVLPLFYLNFAYF